MTSGLYLCAVRVVLWAQRLLNIHGTVPACRAHFQQRAMPEQSPIAIANEFIKIAGFSWDSQMKLHKLVYIAHAWNLAIQNQALVAGSAEAWDNGPVFRRIWNAIRDYGTDTNSLILDSDGDAPEARLSVDEVALIGAVWDRYGKYSAIDLSNMTHKIGTPWTQTFLSKGRNSAISNELIRDHYIKLGQAGRDAARN